MKNIINQLLNKVEQSNPKPKHKSIPQIIILLVNPEEEDKMKEDKEEEEMYCEKE